MKSYFKPWEELKFTDDYMFCKIMKDEGICKAVVETILNIKIKQIEYIVDQEELRVSPESKYVKLDIRLEDEDKIINVELQNMNHQGLAKRARYYQSVSDVEATQKGTFYKDLKDSYVIFICNFDPFVKGLPYYEFENICLAYNPAIRLEDGTKKVFLNVTAKDLSKLDFNLQSLYHYIRDEKVESNLTNTIAQKLSLTKAEIEERKEYMTYTLKLMDYKELGYKEGIEKGIQKGIETTSKDIALKLLQNNIPLEIIINSTGLSKETLEEIKKSIDLN
ncbi:MAG: Rpn family recombination-promoting nuclease/putative transposase [Treponema sp.]|nr:Rpn family recombination-promoting nuclease/putative transposase [Treponema sp.]